MFSVFSLTANAISASRRIALGPELERHALGGEQRLVLLRVRHASVAVRMRSKSSTESESSSTRIGKRPCSSGIRSEGFARWKAPLAMNRMWSVLTMP